MRGRDEPGPGERSRQLLLYAHGFKHLHPEYTVRRLSLELLSKPKPLVYELNGAEYVSPGVAPLDAGVLTEMVDTAESILHDYRHGFERVDDEGQCRDCGYRLYCGWMRDGVCCSGHGFATRGSNIRKNRSLA